MFKARLVIAFAILAVASLLAFLPDNHSAEAAGNFSTGYVTTLNTTAAGGAGHIRTDFGYTVGGSQLNVSSMVGFTPPDASITPGQTIPVGRIVGQVSYNVSLGLLNSPCFSPFTVDFTLRNADTNPLDTIAPYLEGVLNRLGTLRLDLRGATPGSAPNGLPDYIDATPRFNNELLDPADSDVSGALGVLPLRPLARYGGDTNVAGTDLILQFLVFGRSALTAFSASGPTHPWQQFTDDMGYPSLTILQDPTEWGSPSTITDFCAPFSSTAYLAATIDPEVTLVSSECDDAVDDDGVATTTTEVVGDPDEDAIIDVTSTAGFAAPPGTIRIDDELISYAGTTATSFTGVTRGSGGTASAPHALGAPVLQDGFVNDGCPRITSYGEQNECTGARDGLHDDDDNGNGVIGDALDTADDGCGGVGDPGPVGFPEDDECADAVDGSDGLPTGPAYTENYPADGAINDGCPAVGAGENPAVIVAQCAGVANDDGDASATTAVVNDGCPISGPVAETAVGGCAAGDVADSDGDGDVNDGCPTVSAAVPAGTTATRYANPPAATGLYATNTHLYMSLNTSLRDLGDGLENLFDTCPYATNVDDPRLTAGADGDNIDPACDPDPASPCGPGPADDANIADCDLDFYMNAEDNCPLISNPEQPEDETTVPLSISSPDGGPVTDNIGDLCDAVSALADGHYHVTLNVNAICFAPGVDADGDGWCGATEAILGSGPAAVGSTPENIGVDFQLPITNPGATRMASGTSEEGACANLLDDDGDGTVNDGCPAGPAVVVISENAQCDSSVAVPAVGVDDDGDGAVNDGCVPVGPAESGAACSDTIDSDADGAANDGCVTVNNGAAQTCSDGVDNDGDALSDQVDPGCFGALTPDTDADGVCNTAPAGANCVLMPGNGTAAGTDNCPTQPNPTQQNTDNALNLAGATVDPDGAAGATVPAAIPADTLGDACDADDDNDSFTGAITVSTGGATGGVCRSTVSVNIFRDCIENYLGTDPTDNCPATVAVNNEATDAWPVDLNDSSVVDGLDTAAFTTAQTGQNVRADYNGDLSVNLFDLSLLRNLGATGTAFFTKDCSPP